MDSVTGLTNFFNSTMIPALGIIPIWFTHGRYWFLGENDWVETYPAASHKALPGLIAFHAVLWWWERKHKRNPLPEVALGLWGIYILHFLLQIFYVIHVNNKDDDEDNKGHHPHFHNTTEHKDYCVANKYWNTVPVTFCDRMAIGLTIDIWIVMGATLFVSYWTTWDYHENHQSDDDEEETPPPPPTPLPIRNTMKHIQQRMTQSIQPAIIWIPIWFVLGHSVLGSGCFLPNTWDKTIGFLFLGSILVFLPFHWFLDHKYQQHLQQQQQQDDQQQDFTIPKEMTILFVVYYSLHIILQLFVMPPPNNLLQPHYLHSTTIHTISWFCNGLLLLNMLALVGYTHYHFDNSNTNDDQEGNDDEDEQEATPTAATATRPAASAAARRSPAAGEDALREPLLASMQSEDREGRATATATATTTREIGTADSTRRQVEEASSSATTAEV